MPVNAHPSYGPYSGHMTARDDDWRRMGQEASLPPGTRLVRRPYHPPRPSWEHDHCSFCFVTFMAPEEATQAADKEVRTEGYATTSESKPGTDYEWVCLDCFADFAEEFGWVTVKS